MQGLKQIFPSALFLCFSLASYSQQTGFTATIGLTTYRVKNGDKLFVCKGDQITYANKAGNYNTLEWRYDNGSVNTVYNPNFSVTYGSTGNAFYTVQILNKGTATADSLKVTVVVSEKEGNLSANFDYDPKTIECGSNTFTFDASSSTGTGLTYNWNFDDGATATGIKVTHVFNTAVGTSGNSTFNVKLTVTNQDGCSATKPQNVTVKRIPDVTLGNGSGNVDITTFNELSTFCKSEDLSNYDFIFVNNATTAPNSSDTIDWGDGSKQTLINWPANDQVTHNYTAGNHVLVRTGVGSDGCLHRQDFNVFLGKNSGSSFGEVNNVREFCVGEAKEFKFTPGPNNPPGTEYRLHIDDCSEDSVFYDLEAGKQYIVSHTFLVPQCENSCSFVPSYTATLFTITPCDSSPVIVPNLNVYGLPKARISSDTVGCPGSKITANNVSNFGSIYQNGQCLNTGIQVWTVSPSAGVTYDPLQAGSTNGNSADWQKWKNGTSSIDLTFTAAGVYTVTLYISNKKCHVDSITRKICIQEKPKATFQLGDLDADACLSDTVTFLNGTVNGFCLNNIFEWGITNTNESGCSPGNAPVYITGNTASVSPEVWFKEPGNYRIKLKASATDNCFDTTSLPLIIKGKPVVSVSNIGDICVNNSIKPVANAQDCYGDGVLSYAWSFPNGTPGTSDQFNPGDIFYSATGSQTIMFSASNGCGTATVSKPFTVGNKPVSDAGPNLEFCDGSRPVIGRNTGNYTYSWSPSTGLSNPNTATPTVLLSYTGTSADTVTYTLHVSAGKDCDSVSAVRVIVKKSPVIAVTRNSLPADQIAICKSSSAIVTASGADSYLWSPSATVTPPDAATVTLSPLTNTVYTVTGTLANGCQASKEITIVVNDAAVAEAGLPDSVCNGSTIQIGTNTGGSFTYSWQPPNGLSDPNAAVTSLTPSGYTKDTVVKYTLTADAGAGCRAEDSVFIKIKQSPVVSIASPSLPVAVCQGNQVTVVAQGADAYTWQPNPSLNTTSGQQVVITPASMDVYTVTGKLANGCEADTNINVTVNPNAIAAFTPDGYGNCAPFNLDSVIKAEDHPVENSQYTWHILYHGQDSTQTYSSSQSPDFRLSEAGDSAEIYLVAKSRYTCKDSITQSIKIKAGNGIKARFTKSGNGGCEPFPLRVTNTSSVLNNTIRFVWVFGNGDTSYESQPANPVSYYTEGLRHNDTTYYIKLYASTPCVSDSLSDSVHILPKPVASFGTYDSTAKCSPDTTLFDNRSYGNPLRFTWDFADGNSFSTDRDTSVQHIFTTTTLDTFAVKLTAINGCGENTIELPIEVAPNNIRVQVTTFASSLYSCVPDTAHFINNTTNAVSSIWDYGDGTGENLPGNTVSISHVYDTPGEYRITASFDNGCSRGADTEYVHVYERPEADFSVNEPTNKVVCLTDTTTLTINKQTGDYNLIYWGDNNFFYSPPVNQHVYETKGRYLIRLKADRVNTIGTVCSDIDSEYVNVVDKPVVTVGNPGVLTCLVDSSILRAYGGFSYTWLPDINLSNNHIADPVAKPDSTTTYTVSIASDAGCVQQRQVTVKVNREAGQNQFLIPTAFTPDGNLLNDTYHVLNPTRVDSFLLQIYTRWGDKVFETTKAQEGWNGKNKNGKDMPGGTYIYVMRVQSVCAPDSTDKWFHRYGTVVLIR